jgi:putative ABC transport system permease protein
MKCLGALSVFIRRLFLIESALIGGCGSLIGAVGGALLSIVFTLFQYGIAATLRSLPLLSLLAAVVGAVVTGTVLSVLAAIYPARFAARMLPAAALRSTV